MTHLRKIMLEELQRRHYSENTTRSYLRAVEDFARRFHCPPDRLGPREIREYQAELFQKRNLSPATVATRLAALRFFYTKTLNRAWSIAETPYPKKAHHLPTILSQQEVAQLIDSAGPPPPTHPANDALRHRSAQCRVDSIESQRHRQPAHGDSRPRRQRPQRSRCAA